MNKIIGINNISTIPSTKPHILEATEYEVAFFNSILEIREVWDKHTLSSTFLESSFLEALEHSPPSGASYRYGMVSKGGEYIGVIYYQLKKIALDESLRLDKKKDNGFFASLLTGVKGALAKWIRYNILAVGNLTLTGTYGHYFSGHKEEKWEIIEKATSVLVKVLKKEGTKISGILMKDYTVENKPKSPPRGFAEFKVEPNMTMVIPDAWNTMDDYMAAMKSKYRVRVRRARKKSSTLTKKLLTLDEIAENSMRITELYKYVADGAGFNLFTLPHDYFWSLQKHLGEKMKLTAYYRDSEMVGFYTSIQNYDELDAHFLGYDPTCNHECQLYLNMLYDLVEEAILSGSHQLIMSRTALEIKSSVGAVANPMYLYMKSTNSLVNRVLPRALAYFIPEVNWKSRSPFK